jgi:PAS domain-containing protein
MTYRLITASGEERWVWEQGRGVPGSCDGVMVLEGYITDITDRVRAEAALAESEELFRSIFEEAGIGILLTDTHGRIVKQPGTSSRFSATRRRIRMTPPNDLSGRRG